VQSLPFTCQPEMDSRAFFPLLIFPRDRNRLPPPILSLVKGRNGLFLLVVWPSGPENLFCGRNLILLSLLSLQLGALRPQPPLPLYPQTWGAEVSFSHLAERLYMGESRGGLFPGVETAAPFFFSFFHTQEHRVVSFSSRAR